MKVAKARYLGRTRQHTRRTPSGERYVFPKRSAEDPWIEIESVEDAEHLETIRNIEIEWSTGARLLARGKKVLSEGYQEKRSIASDLDLSFDGQPDEETLDESLANHIDELQEGGEL